MFLHIYLKTYVHFITTVAYIFTVSFAQARFRRLAAAVECSADGGSGDLVTLYKLRVEVRCVSTGYSGH